MKIFVSGAFLASLVCVGGIAAPPSSAQQLASAAQVIPGKQCVYNKGAFSLNVDWYDPGVVVFNGTDPVKEANDYTKYVINGKPVASKKDLTLGFSSCVEGGNRTAVARIVGHDIANNVITIATGTAVGIVTGVAGAFACAGTAGAACFVLAGVGPAAAGAAYAAGEALPDVKEIAYIGSPGTKNYLDLSGTVWKVDIANNVPLGNGRCLDGKVNEAGLCYTPCRAGYKGVATMCVPSCPSGYTDTGLHCAKPAAYGRGAGFPWKFGDKAFSLDGARARCFAANPQGCEQSGAIWYPKCRSGFKPIGSNICTPECPSGMTDIGVSCQKATYDRGVGTIPQ